MRLRRFQLERRRRAFTLLEVLVVMAIFSVAVGMTVPVISKARARSQEVFCQSNLRILWSGLQQYTMDNQDRYPLGFAFNKFSPTTGRATDAGSSGYITWFSSIDMYLTSGRNQIIMLDANSGFIDGATTRNFHSAFQCPSVTAGFQQKVHYYQHGVVMPHLTLEIPDVFRLPGIPLIRPAKVNQVYPNTALIWDTFVYGNAAPVTPWLFWGQTHTTSGFATFVTEIDSNVFGPGADNGLLCHPELPERRFRSPGADRFASSVNPLKNSFGPIAFLSDQYMQANTPFPTGNTDFSGGSVWQPGNARFRHTGLGCNVLFADGSARTLYLRPFRKVANGPPGTTSANFIDSDFRRNMLMIKWPPGVADPNNYPTN